jgi:endoglucanase
MGLLFRYDGTAHYDKKWTEEGFVKLMEEWGFNKPGRSYILRVPIQQENYNVWSTDDYFHVLDTLVEIAEKHHVYLLVDWHVFGNLSDPGLHDRTIRFWQLFANKYKDSPAVLYEIFNEPYDISWNEWKVQVTEVIDTIRAIDPDSVIFVSGMDWGFDLRGVKSNPIDRGNIVYVSHVYAPKPRNWDEYFGFLSTKYPLFVSEFGIENESEISFARDLIQYMEGKRICWTAWVLWEKSLVESDWHTKTSFGRLVASNINNENFTTALP